MSTERNKAIVRRYFEELFNKHNLSIIDEFFSQNYINNQHYDPNAGAVIRGRQEWKEVASIFFTAFPDHHSKLEDIIAEGDKVVYRWRTEGTHQGPFLNIAPTYKKISINGITIDRVENGKVVETWTTWDTLTLMKQLGVAAE